MRRNDFWGAGFYVLLAAATVLLCASGGLGRFNQAYGHILPASYSLLYMLQQENFSPLEFWRAYGL